MTRHANLAYLLHRATEQQTVAVTHSILVGGKVKAALEAWLEGTLNDAEMAVIVECSREARKQVDRAAEEVARIKRLLDSEGEDL